MTKFKFTAIALALTAASAAQAQSSVTLYGDIDQYINYLHSSSGAKVKSLEDGDWLRSRIGFRGVEDLGSGAYAKFQMEGGFSADNGNQADTTRFFDRQSWVGLGTKSLGEIRFGRQNGPIQSHGGFVDYTARNMGSVINVISVPSRYDNDFSYLSPTFGGFAFEVHGNLPESTVGNKPQIYQAWLGWTNTTFSAGYMGARALAPKNAVIDKAVSYDNVYANWNYGPGTVYLTYLRTNEITSSGTGATLLKTSGTILAGSGGTGGITGINAGTDPNLNNFYRAWQVSADYRVLPALRVGALYGQIKSPSNLDAGAKGGSVGAYYDLSPRTMLIAMVEEIKNDTNASFRPAASGGLKTNFTTANDVNGRTIKGVQLGIVHRF